MCVQWCPESALSLKGKTTDKIVTGDIGCYTLGFMALGNKAFRDGADYFISKGDDACMENILAQVEGAMARGPRN